MTSLLRSSKGNLPVTKFVAIKSLSYWDMTLSHEALIPFTYKNGVLDINSQDGIPALLTTPGGGIIGGGYSGLTGYTSRMVKMMGGSGLVTSLGPNFDTWIRAVIVAQYSLGTYTGPITIQVAPVMTKVQQNFPGPGQYSAAALHSQRVIEISNEPPESDEYIVAGDKYNKFFSVWVFRSPLTLMFLNVGVPTYVTLQTQFTNPN